MGLLQEAQEINRLFGDAVEQLGKLVQNEAQLAKAELSQKLTQAVMGAGYVAGAAILIIPVLVMLLITLALWLIQMGLSPVVSHLLAAVAGAVISGLLAVIGLRHLKAGKLTPNVTLHEVEKDVAAVKEMAR
jgi:VIT1/CCC1 family predicted Fe2+/Mn2+ transporter